MEAIGLSPNYPNPDELVFCTHECHKGERSSAARAVGRGLEGGNDYHPLVARARGEVALGRGGGSIHHVFGSPSAVLVQPASGRAPS